MLLIPQQKKKKEKKKNILQSNIDRQMEKIQIG